MIKKKKKHKPCSYMQPSPDGRRKTTIKLQKEKERIDFTTKQMDKFEKDIEACIKVLEKYEFLDDMLRKEKQ